MQERCSLLRSWCKQLELVYEDLAPLKPALYKQTPTEDKALRNFTKSKRVLWFFTFTGARHYQRCQGSNQDFQFTSLVCAGTPSSLSLHRFFSGWFLGGVVQDWLLNWEKGVFWNHSNSPSAPWMKRYKGQLSNTQGEVVFEDRTGTTCTV